MDDAHLIGGREKRAIVIADYDDAWPRRFEAERDRISGSLGDRALRIEHVGSTSVPRLAAKPIIDIAVAVECVDDPGAGLAAAIRLGIDRAGSGAVAVLLGDLPALRGDDVREALDAAADYPRAMVPDADGLGTVLVTARPSERHRPAFGTGSRAAHRAAGYHELDIDAKSGLRRDVDTPGDLKRLAGRLGPRTAAALAAERQATGPTGLASAS